ncbi:MAG: cytochrome c [Anaerolineales bacterium]|nr:cytochrome c [Anaerolineales bacterium]
MPFARSWKPALRLAVKGLAAVLVVGLVSAGIAALAQAQPLAQPPAQSAGDGETIFKTKCTPCHTIGGGHLVGPDLKDVTTRRTRDWLTQWISAPDQMLAAKDPIAVQLLAENNNIPMPNLALTEAEVASIIAYFETNPTVLPAQQPALPTGDPAIGRELFTGAVRFQNGGPPCMGCHSVAGIGALGGGALGPDLTPAFNKYGDAGLAQFLNSVPTVTMNAVWSGQPLTPDEQADIWAFLQQASVSGRPIQALGQLAALALAGTLVLLNIAHFYWRRRLVAVRRPLVARSRISS